MTNEEFTRQQYLTLCEEIRAAKSRIFWLMILGVGLVFAAGYLAASQQSAFSNAAIPFLVIALMLSYIVEQNNIARAGRYIREVVEPRYGEVHGWERWLESKPALREVDHYFVIGFSVLFLVFFAITTSLSLRTIDRYAHQKYVVTAAVAYSLGAVLIAYVLWRHWRTASAASSLPHPTE